MLQADKLKYPTVTEGEQLYLIPGKTTFEIHNAKGKIECNGRDIDYYKVKEQPDVWVTYIASRIFSGCRIILLSNKWSGKYLAKSYHHTEGDD